MFEFVPRVVAWLMNRVRVNRTERGIRNGVPVIIKRRVIGSGVVLWIANRFLSLARSEIFMFARADKWMEWESYCSHLLYPKRPQVSFGSGEVIYIAEVNGMSLRQLLSRCETDINPFVAAARELRRVHRIQCRHFKAAWSHGDLHLGNILYDRAANQAILIDFDTRHRFGIDQTWRHSDDLSVFLLELIASDQVRWQEYATAFLEEYGNPLVLQELDRRLVSPRGFAKVLWYARTQCASIHQSEQRLQCLRQILRRITSVSEE